jgi:hypothetical protein
LEPSRTGALLIAAAAGHVHHHQTQPLAASTKQGILKWRESLPYAACGIPAAINSCSNHK